MAGNFFRGTSVEQDGRWGKSDEKLMAKMAKNGMFASILDTKVNLKKVNLDVINKWITQRIIEVVGFEDEILINLVINMLQGVDVDGRKMQLDVTGFLEKQSGSFVAELWSLLVDAQEQPSGIPTVFLQKKKEEILQRQSTSNRFGPAQGDGSTVTQVRTDSSVLTDHNPSTLSSKEDLIRGVKSSNDDRDTRKRERSKSPERRSDRRDYREGDRQREDRRRDPSPGRRDRDKRSPDRRDRDRRDSRSERDDRGRADRSHRHRDSRDRERRDDRHRDRSPDRSRRDTHRDRHSHDRRSPARRSRRDDSRDRRPRDRRNSSPSPEVRRRRQSSSDREDARIESKETRSRDSSSDRDLEQSDKWVKAEDDVVAE